MPDRERRILLHELPDDHEGYGRPQWLELRVPQTPAVGAGMESGEHQAVQKAVEVQLPLDPFEAREARRVIQLGKAHDDRSKVPHRW